MECWAFRVLVDFVRTCEVAHHSWVLHKRQLADTEQLVSAMYRELGTFIRWNTSTQFVGSGRHLLRQRPQGDHDLVNGVFNATLNNVEVRKVIPADYSLFQAADLCCKTMDRKQFGD